MNRNKFLIAAATVGMIAATGVTYAQQERNAPSGGARPNQSAPQNNQGFGKEGGAAQQNPGRGETTGQGQLQNRDRDQSGQSGQSGQSQRERNQPGQVQQNRDRNETTGQGQLQNRDRDQSGQSQRNQPGQVQQNRELNRNRNETTGQSPQNERRDQNRANEERRQDRNEGANVNERENRTTGQGAAGSRANVNITAEQRTRIHDVILKERSAPRSSSVNFDVRVGSKVPRTVRFAPLPLTIIEIEPAWRGYEYFLVGEEIVVVDPNTMEIVAVIET
jgi:hypothetical protein